MKLIRRGAEAPSTADEPVADVAVLADPDLTRRKGAPTPKRRDARGGTRGPVTAPKNRKEAYARQKEIASKERATSAAAPVKPRSAAEQRAALRRGDVDAMPRRDQGDTKKLARDWVDSHRMLSNFLWLLIPLFILSFALGSRGGIIESVILAFMAVLLVEWYVRGRMLRKLAVARFGKADGSPLSIGWYMGSRAYLPRKWRLPAPQVRRGDEI